ncbi:MAG TPA: DUF2946 family protein [Caulobacteraceae bacterium]|nr:DUF2946 family protein [Caulobacteraceae bacterium]
MTAILAAFALLMQALAPTVATAAPAQGATLEICSAGEARTVTLGHAEHHKGFFGLKCVDCVVASLAGAAPIAPPVPTRVGEAIRLRPSIDRTDSLGPRNPPRVREQSPRAPPTL